MKPIRTILSTLSSKALFLAIIATTTAIPAADTYAAVGGPLQVLYLWSGALDTAALQVSTRIACTSFSGVTETLNFQARDSAGTSKANQSINIVTSGTITAWTHTESLDTADIILTTGAFQGTVAVLATSVNIVCTAALVQNNVNTPIGFMLHGARFNPISGTQE